MCVCVCVCVCFRIILYVNCFGRTVLCVCIEYRIEYRVQVNTDHVGALGVDERILNVDY